MTGHIYDVAVIGAGIGGLTAAALCASAGLDVLVLEGHTRPGGCAGDFTRRGILFPAGATVVMGFEEGGLHRQVYERLGLPIAARPLDLAMTVQLPDRVVRVPTDAAAWQHEYRRAFPSLERRGERFWSRIRALGSTAHHLATARPTLPIATPRDLLDAARLIRPSLVPGMISAAPALWQTVADLLRAADVGRHRPLRRFVDNQLLISMQCLADECAALSGALALDVYRYGTFHLPGGAATIARDLLRALAAHGGACRYRSTVRRIERLSGTWTLTTATDDRVTARSVIANLPPGDLAGLLAPQPRSLQASARGRVQPWGAVVLYAAIEATDLPLPFPRYFQVIDSYDGPLEDGGSCFVSLLGPEQARFPTTARLTVSTHTRVEPWWDHLDRPRYQGRKRQIGEKLLQAAESAIPGVRGRMLFSEVATPRSFQRWIGRSQGRVGGVAQTRATAHVRALSHRTELPGLLLCGDSVFPGQGTIGVTLSGINAARDATRHVKGLVRRGYTSTEQHRVPAAGRPKACEAR